jgi:hypothetical protein
MGHSSVEVTEKYLKDFNVRSARQEQDKFSPVNTLDLLGKQTRVKGKKAKVDSKRRFCCRKLVAPTIGTGEKARKYCFLR